MSAAERIGSRIETVLWPFVARVVRSWAVPGVAVCVVHDGDHLAARGFGTRDGTTGEPVTPDTLFHLASISKSFVATAALQLVEAGDLDLDRGVTAYLPDLPWADPRAGRITLRHLLSHRSGLGDVAGDYGWHEPELDDGALERFARTVAGWRLEQDPGTIYAYSNAAYEVVGHLLATVTGEPFEACLRRRVLRPAGMATSTFTRAEVPSHLGALPHLGLPPRVLPGAYPYTRRHAPSSTLHSSAAELGRWMVAHLAGGAGIVSRTTQELTWTPVADAGGEWHAQMALGWFRGQHRGLPVVNHSGSDPGFETNLGLLPEHGVGVAVLADSNTAPIMTITRAALDVVLGHEPADPPLPPATVRLGRALETSGVAGAAQLFHRLAEEDPPSVDVEEPGLEDAVWGAIEMHRTDVVWPVLTLWRQLRPDSSSAWSSTGWAHAVDGRRETAVGCLRRALAIDPGNDEARSLLRHLTHAR